MMISSIFFTMRQHIFVVLSAIVFFVPFFVSAYVPSIMVQDSLKDIEVIADPELSQGYHGELQGFPHTYEIRATEPFTLFTQILQPDIDSSINNISGIIIKEQGRGNRVEKVADLFAKDAAWETEYEPIGGNSYRKGPMFETELQPGIYRIEVHTPDNLEKYVLVVGKREEMRLGYFELLGRIAEVKVFFEKSKFWVIQSPLVYVPLLILSIILGYVFYRKRRVGSLG